MVIAGVSSERRSFFRWKLKVLPRNNKAIDLKFLISAKSDPQRDQSLTPLGINEPSKGLGQRVKAYWLLSVLSLIWGLAFVAIRRADFELSPINLALLRWFISSAAYGIILIFLGRLKIRFQKADLPRLLVISFAYVPLYHLALNYAETSVSSGLAGILISLGPVFFTVFSAVTLKERITSNIALALVLAVLGASILSIGDLSSTGGLIGPAEVVLSALAYAVFSVLSKPLVKKYGPLHVALWTGLLGTSMLLPLVSSSFISQTEAPISERLGICPLSSPFEHCNWILNFLHS